jgi:hypothetical protein
MIKTFIKQIFQDKNGNFSIREVIVTLFVLIVIISWLAQQFFGKDIPSSMFYAFISLIAAGCFGYSLEERQPEANLEVKTQEFFNNEKTEKQI